jgi:hypothetical protein
MRIGQVGVHIRLPGFQYLKAVWEIGYIIERLIMPLKSTVCFEVRHAFQAAVSGVELCIIFKSIHDISVNNP